jgi:flagellar biosynthetic protein FliR
MIDLSVLGAGYVLLLQGLFAFCRIGAFVSVSPIFGSRLVPTRVRLLIALALTAVMLPSLPQQPESFFSLSPAFWLRIASEVLMGVALGFATQLFFHLFVMGGQIIALQMGLGFASMFDPDNGAGVTVVGQFYMLMVTMVFLAMNGHLVLLQFVLESYRVSTFFTPEMGGDMVELGAFMFGGALLVSLPAVTALLLVNLAFGVLTRAAPQLNIFSLGFPMTLLFGVIVLWVSSAGWLPQFDALSLEFFALLSGRFT